MSDDRDTWKTKYTAVQVERDEAHAALRAMLAERDVVVRIWDMSDEGTGPWRLMVNGVGCADWPWDGTEHDAQAYAEEVARCVAVALAATPCASAARLDEDGTAKPITEIVGVFKPDGRPAVGAQAEELLVRRTSEALPGDVAMWTAIENAFLSAVHEERPCPFCLARTDNVWPYCVHFAPCILHDWSEKLNDRLDGQRRESPRNHEEGHADLDVRRVREAGNVAQGVAVPPGRRVASEQPRPEGAAPADGGVLGGVHGRSAGSARGIAASVSPCPDCTIESGACAAHKAAAKGFHSVARERENRRFRHDMGARNSDEYGACDCGSVKCGPTGHGPRDVGGACAFCGALDRQPCIDMTAAPNAGSAILAEDLRDADLDRMTARECFEYLSRGLEGGEAAILKAVAMTRAHERRKSR